MVLASGFDRIELPYLKILNGNEYNTWALFIGNDKISCCVSSGVTGSETSEEKGTELGRYLQKSCLDCGIADANLGPTDAKGEFNTLDILTGSVRTFLLSGSLIEVIHILCLELFLLLFIREFIPCQICFALLRLAVRKKMREIKIFTYSSK